LPSVGDSEIVQAFLSSTTCRDLVRELGRNVPRSAATLLDIATNFALGEEAVGAIFPTDNAKGKQRDEAPEASAPRLPKRKKKDRQGKWAVLKADMVAAAERKNPRGPRGPKPFDDMLKKPCPYHQGPVKHALEDSSMLRRYYARLGPPDDDAKQKGTDDWDDDKDDGFPEVHNAFMIFGGPSACLTAWQQKREHQEVFLVKVATPRYLDWSREAITFDRDDHPDHVSNPGQYPLVVDPIIGNTRLSKVLMDGGSGLNILYANTLELLEIDRSRL
jgi:hypothetical protein